MIYTALLSQIKYVNGKPLQNKYSHFCAETGDILCVKEVLEDIAKAATQIRSLADQVEEEVNLMIVFIDF